MADCEQLKAEGNFHFKKKEYEKALQFYNNAIMLDPQNSIIYSNAAMALINLNRNHEAIKMCEKGLLHINGTNNADDKIKQKLQWRLQTSKNNLIESTFEIPILEVEQLPARFGRLI